MSIIVDISVQLFTTTSRHAVDSDGHTHPGPPVDISTALLTITDSDGVSGHCLAPPELVGPAQLNGYIRPVLGGRDPLRRAELWQALHRRQRGAQSLLPDRALAIVDQALWDLAGRALDTPVWKLLGGARSRAPAYASTMCGDTIPGGLSTPAEYAAFALELQALGYAGVKLHTWMPPVAFAPSIERDIEACEAVREAVGPSYPLMLDANHWYSRMEALQLGRAMDRLGYTWYEEPMEEDSTQSYRWLTEQIATPIIGPESVAGGLAARAEWVANQACDILRVGVPTCGGITPAMKTLALAEAFGMECELHGAGPGSLAVMGATHNSRWYERGMLHPQYDYDTPPPHLTRIIDPLTEDGHVEMPDEPGLGEPIDHDYITASTTQKW